MRDILSDDEIRVELKRILDHEKARMLLCFDEAQDEVRTTGPEAANPGMPTEIFEQKLREIHDKLEQKKGELSFVFKQLTDFIDRQ